MPRLIVALLMLSFPSLAQAGDETQTLPKGRFGIRLNNVFVTGVDYQFGHDGQLRTVGDTHASSIKDQGLHQAQGMLNDSPVGKYIFDQVIAAMQSSQLGQLGLNLAQATLQSMDLGVMKTNIVPTSTVTAPTIMYGVTNRWSMVVNVPFIKMREDVSWDYVPGSSTATLNQISAAANAIGVAVPNSSQFVSLAQQEIIKRGYKPLESEEKSFIGDIRLMQLIDLGKSGSFAFGTMNTIQLPTGPAHDPTNLLDPGSFHHTFIEQELTTVYSFTKKFKAYASGGVRYNLPEKTDFRVPKDEYDLDPDASQTEAVTRQIGFGTFVEAGLKYRVLSRFEVSGGAIHNTREADKFTGEKNSHYELLSNAYPYGAEQSSSFKAGLRYDPLSNYQMGSIPLMVDVDYQQTFAGTNTPQIKQLMISFSTFF